MATKQETAALVAADSTETVMARRARLVLPVGRGARGKTVLLRWMVDRARNAGREVVLGDLDRTNRTLAGFFHGTGSPISAVDADVRDWFGLFLEAMIEHPVADAAVDFGGGDVMLKQIAHEMDLGGFLTQNGVDPVLVYLFGPDIDDLAYLRDMETVFAPERTVLVLNEGVLQGRGTQAFERLSQHSIFRAAVDRGARPVVMPWLRVMEDVDDRRLGFIEAEIGGKLGRFRAQYVAAWRRQMEAAFAPVLDWLP